MTESLPQVLIQHPDLPGETPSVPTSAVPFWRNAGWSVVEGQALAHLVEDLPVEAQRFEGQDQVRLKHPDLDEVITVAASAVPTHRGQGWVPVEEATQTELEGLTVDQLKDRARAAGLPVSGTKAELVDRLREQQTQAGEPADQEPPPEEPAGDQPAPDSEEGQ